jgi:hypothetical protein
LGAVAAVVLGHAPHGAGHVVPPQHAVADVPAAVALLQHPTRHGVVVEGAGPREVRQGRGRGRAPSRRKPVPGPGGPKLEVSGRPVGGQTVVVLPCSIE